MWEFSLYSTVITAYNSTNICSFSSPFSTSPSQFVSRNEPNAAYRPSVVAAYTSDGYLRDAYRRATGAYGSPIEVDRGARRLKGIKMCHRLDIGTSNSASFQSDTVSI
jgi:hypothetical protein